MRTTVLIPLHVSARWLPVVTGNIERLAQHARLVVSDATGVDDTLDLLRRRFEEHPGIEWVGPRPLAPGWVSHCNDLVSRAETEFVMWLPHDDEIGADWVTLGERALDANPAAVLALGPVRSLERDDQGIDDGGLPSRITIGSYPPFQDNDVVSRVTEAVGVCLHGNQSWLGVAFRGVFRREPAVLLPESGTDGAWADILWAIGMLTVGAFTPTEAVYRKRWYDGNTHGTWADRRTAASFRAEALPKALAQLSPEVREQVLVQGWAHDASAMSSTIARLKELHQDLEPRVDALQRELHGERAAVVRLRRKLRSARAARARVRRDFESSTSWKLTAPIRGIARKLERLRRN